MNPFLRGPLARIALLLGIGAGIGWSAPSRSVEDSLLLQQHYHKENARMKAGHRQVRVWKASFDSLRREQSKEIYGSAMPTPSGSAPAARSSATTATAPPTPLGTEHSFAGGRLKGRWVQNRVTNTTAKGGYGSGVRLDRVAYDSATNTVHALTTEGNLVSAPLTQMGSWRIVNHVVQFDIRSFVGIRPPSGPYRLVGMGGNVFRWSDDLGLTWTESVGGTSSNGTPWAAALPSGEILALVGRAGQTVLIRSKDHGSSFQDVQVWSGTGGAAGTFLYNTQDACVILRSTGTAIDVHRYGGGALTRLGAIPSGSRPSSLTGTVSSGATRLYARTADGTGWSSTDGATWKNLGAIPEDLHTVVPDNPDVVFSNGPEHELTRDGGLTWASYPNNNTSIGWDPKHLTFFRIGGKWTMVVANDMGLCFNDNPLDATSWRYVNSNHTYAILHGGFAVDNHAVTVTSNQDPGTFELTRTARDTFLATNRSGADGLRAAPSNGGKAYWYRHYWASFMHGHAASVGNTRTAAFDVAGDWYTPPFKGSTKDGEDAIWVSGWDQLFKLTYVASSNSITRTDLPKNFAADAGAVTYGVGVAKSDPNRLYVATRNGRFFTSKDGGQTWTETTYSGPKPTPQGGAWNMSSGLYIEVADSDPDLVFWGGGTGAVACLISRDGGKTFTSSVTGIPTGSAIRNVSLAPDGKLAFSSNFHVWIASDNRWYDLRTASMPSAALPAANALNYLPLQRKVRYFTWGAGVVDLDLTSLNTTDNPEVAPDPKACFQIRGLASGKALTAGSAGSVVQATFGGGTNQTWRIVPQDNFWRVENTGTGSVLQVASGSYKESALAQVGAWSGGDHQQWNLVRAGSDYVLAARHSVKALQVAGASTADSAKAEQGVYLGTSSQKWSLVPATNCGTTPVRATAPMARLRLETSSAGLFRIGGLDESTAHVLVWDNNGRIVHQGEIVDGQKLPRFGAGLYRIRVWSTHLDETLTGTSVR